MAKITDGCIFYGKSSGYTDIERVLDPGAEEAAFSAAAKRIIDACVRYGIRRRPIQCYLAYLLMQDENPFSLACERREAPRDSLRRIAEQDIARLMPLFFPEQEPEILRDFQFYKDYGYRGMEPAIGEAVMALTEKLARAANAEKFTNVLAEFYREQGVGVFGLYPAFSVDVRDGAPILIPGGETAKATFDDLWGYEDQKRRIAENTESFIAGKSANNVLLYGDSGTGKSTCIKALLNRYAGDGVRIIEVYKHQFSHLPVLIDLLRGRNYRFILYMDDLSFEEFEIEYKYLKAVIEGGLAPRPDNVLIYATSNRRHLIRETWRDRDDMEEDIHHSDTVEEKLSLADRFGVAIRFDKPLQADYCSIVLHLKKKYGVTVPDEELLHRAKQWGISHGGLSGRAAEQFIRTVTAGSSQP